jgi:outer membrane protein OmpA-like peptidoglycan-associated protein
MHLQLAVVLMIGLSYPESSVAPLVGPPSPPSVRVAGICVGTAQDCLREAIADGELSPEEIALPYEVFVTFAHDSAELSEEAQNELRTLAIVLNEPLLWPRKFLVEGHTDAKGGAAYNQAQSEPRALAVKDYLGSVGVDPDRLSSIGMGETKPRVSDPRAPENRRVELRIIPE